MLPCSAIFYRVDSWTWNGSWQTNFILQRFDHRLVIDLLQVATFFFDEVLQVATFRSPSCDLLQEEDHKTNNVQLIAIVTTMTMYAYYRHNPWQYSANRF